MTNTERANCSVDVHAHAIPPRLIDRAASGAFSGVDLDSGDGAIRFQFPRMDTAPPAPVSLTDFESMATWAAGRGVDLQLLGPWTDLLGYTLDEVDARKWTRVYNESLVDECSSRSGMVPVATIPMSYPAAALDELVAAREMGCRGVMIGTDIPDLHLGSPELDPVWAVAADLGMPIIVHPTFLRVPKELHEAGLKNAVGRAGPTAVALTKLIYSGALVRHRDLVVVGCHGGGALAAVTARILRNHEVGWSGSEYDPSESIDRLFFDSVVLDPTYLAYLVKLYGSERILLGSDHPFPWEPDPIRVVDEAGLTDTDRAQIVGGNAQRLFGPDLCRREGSGSDAAPSAGR